MVTMAAIFGTVLGSIVVLAIVEVIGDMRKPPRNRSKEEMAYLREQARREGRYVE